MVISQSNKRGRKPHYKDREYINNTVMSYKSENWKEKLEQVRNHIL